MKSLPKQAVRAKLRAYLESGMANIPDGVVVFDRQGRFAYVNPTCLKKLGRKEKDFIGKTLPDVSPPFMSIKTLRELTKRVRRRMETSEPIIGAEVELIGKGGKPLPVSYSAAVLRDEKGKVTGELVFLRDITELKRAQKALQESEEKYRTLFENANDAILIADTETECIIDANKAAEKLFGRPRKEIIGINRLRIHPPNKAEYYKKHFKKHVRLGRTVDFDAEIMTKSGRVVLVSLSTAVMTIGGRKVIQGIFRDMTELKRAEEERKKLTKELVTMSGTVTDAVKKMSTIYRKRIEELEKLVAELSKKQ